MKFKPSIKEAKSVNVLVDAIRLFCKDKQSCRGCMFFWFCSDKQVCPEDASTELLVKLIKEYELDSVDKLP